VTTPAAIDEAYAAARETWPGVELDRQVFAAWVDERSESSTVPPYARDLYLACACARGDAAGVRAFERELVPKAAAAARALEPESDFVSEVVQRLRTRLLGPRIDGVPRIADYGGRGPLAGWVGVTATRLGLSLLRELKRAQRFDDERWAAALAAPVTDDLELDYLKERHREDFVRALSDACGGLPARERTVLRMHFVEGLNIDRIGQIYGVHRATAARWLAKGRHTLYAETRRRLATALALSEDDFSSFDRLLRSQLDVSLPGLFADGDD